MMDCVEDNDDDDDNDDRDRNDDDDDTGYDDTKMDRVSSSRMHNLINIDIGNEQYHHLHSLKKYTHMIVNNAVTNSMHHQHHPHHQQRQN